jgi:hypothetical protein
VAFHIFREHKKIAYAAGLDGTRVVPIQGLTALVYIGSALLWTPEVFLFMVALWIVVFLYTGRSSVTESRVSFYVLRHKT